MKFNLNDFFKKADEGKIFAYYNQDNTLVGFKYSRATQYSMDWDEISLCSRGITFDVSTGEIVAFPFKKFFNFEELYDLNMSHTTLADSLPKEYCCNDLTKKFRVMEKYDGSLGIAFNYKDKWIIKTSGSFDSEQSTWATEFLNKQHNTDCLNKDYTYCFEIIYDEDVHPIHYDFEDLVLLAVIDTQTGIEKPIEEIRRYSQFGYKVAQEYEFGNFANVFKFAKRRDNMHEGVVVTFEDGWKTKIKGDEFLKLQKLFHNITKENIWSNFDWFNEKYDDFNFIMNIPEELKSIKEYAANLPILFEEKRNRLLQIANSIDSNLDRKATWATIVSLVGDNKMDASIIMKMKEGNLRYKEMIWKTLKP